MMFKQIFICASLAIFAFAITVTAFKQEDEKRDRFLEDLPRETYELMCLTAHNELRLAEGLNVLKWDEDLTTSANIEATKNMLEEQIFIDLSFLENSEQEFNTDDVFFKIPEKATHSQMQMYMAIVMDDKIKSWYMDGLFNEDEDRSQRMLSPAANAVGCSMRGYAFNKTTLHLFIAVAYDYQYEHASREVEEDDGINARAVALNDGLMCFSNCSFGQICYSHRSSPGFMGERAAVISKFDEIEDGNCECRNDEEYKIDADIQKPSCEGPCYVNCPLAENEDKISCFGKDFCTCSVGYGGAMCL